MLNRMRAGEIIFSLVSYRPCVRPTAIHYVLIYILNYFVGMSRNQSVTRDRAPSELHVSQLALRYIIHSNDHISLVRVPDGTCYP